MELVVDGDWDEAGLAAESDPSGPDEGHAAALAGDVLVDPAEQRPGPALLRGAGPPGRRLDPGDGPVQLRCGAGADALQELDAPLGRLDAAQQRLAEQPRADGGGVAALHLARYAGLGSEAARADGRQPRRG